MRHLLLVLCCAGLLGGLAACGSDSENSPAEAPQTSAEAKSGPNYQTDPVPAPDVTMTTLDGQEINLAQQDGKVVLVNFWATWCAPCRKEIPDLIDLYDEHKSDGLMVVGIALDKEGAEVVKPFVEKEKVNYPIVIDTSKTIESQFDAMYGLPTTYVVNSEGKIVRRILGIFPVEKMEPKLEEMLQSGDAA